MATVIDPTPTAHRARHERLEQLLRLQGAVLRNRKQMLRESQPSGVMDVEERSLDGEEERVRLSVLELTSRTVQGIETALQRLRAGAFGTCSDCGGCIGAARLRALPFAAVCVACQEKRDMGVVSVASPAPAGWEERLASYRRATAATLGLASVE